MLDRHPIAVAASVIVTLATMAAGVAGGWFFIVDERERSLAQSETLAAIRGEQVAIRKELALQTADLEEIRRTQASIVHAVENGNDRVVNAVAHGSLALAVELGRVAERTEEAR